MIISEDPFFTGASYEPYAATKPWTLSAGFGIKTVYAKLKTAGGVETNVFSDTIDFEASCGAGPTPTPPPTSTPTPTPTPVIERAAVPVPTLDTRSLAALALVLAAAGMLLVKRVLK
jgi:hypothetical protein